MDRLFSHFFVLASILVAAPVFAEPETAQETLSEAPTLRPVAIALSGHLKALDSSADPAEMVVEDRYGVDKSVEVPAGTPVSRGERPWELKQLKPGMPISVNYIFEAETGRRTATAITVEEPSEKGF